MRALCCLSISSPSLHSLGCCYFETSTGVITNILMPVILDLLLPLLKRWLVHSFHSKLKKLNYSYTKFLRYRSVLILCRLVSCLHIRAQNPHFSHEVLTALTAPAPRNPILLASTPTPITLSTSPSKVRMGAGMRISDHNKIDYFSKSCHSTTLKGRVTGMEKQTNERKKIKVDRSFLP